MQMRRLVVDTDTVAAGLKRLGIEPPEHSSLHGLSAPRAQVRTLRQAEVMTDDGILPEFEAALRVLSAPTTIVTTTSNKAGLSLFHTANFVRGPVGGPIVMQAKTEDGRLDLALFPSVTEATVALDQLLGITAFPAGAPDSWQLGLPGYAALLAMSDALLDAQLTARLQRRLPAAPPAITPELLEEQLAAGIEGNDTRWAVTAGQVTMLRGLQPAAGRMTEGLEELLARGLALNPGNAVYPSGHGDALAALLAQIYMCGSVALSHVVEEAPVLVAFLSVFRSVAGLLAANVSADADETEIEVVRATQAGMILLLRGLLEHEAPGPELLYQPAAAGAPADTRPRRRSPQPATPVRTAAPTDEQPAPPPPTPAPPPPAPAPEPVWEPSHHVPPGGIDAWEVPDPGLEPVAALDPGLPVRVDRVDTGWAHVTCSNTWTCWVDASLLVPIEGGGR